MKELKFIRIFKAINKYFVNIKFMSGHIILYFSCK